MKNILGLKRRRSAGGSSDDEEEDDIPVLQRINSRSASMPRGHPRDLSSPVAFSEKSVKSPKMSHNKGLDYHKIVITDVDETIDESDCMPSVGKGIEKILKLRRDFVWFPEVPRPDHDISNPEKYTRPVFPSKWPAKLNVHFEYKDGVFTPYDENQKPLFDVPSWASFFHALKQTMKVVTDGAVGSFAYKRLMILEARFELHMLMNANIEANQQKTVPHRDFYNVRKVDNHVHHSACMNQKHMLRFIKHKLKTEPNCPVIKRDGKTMTLSEVFDSLNLSPYDMSVDMLDMHAKDAFHRFDRFNNKYALSHIHERQYGMQSCA